jgi:hypothetical protein
MNIHVAFTFNLLLALKRVVEKSLSFSKKKKHCAVIL